MPRISVLMPAFNAEATVQTAATSTLRALPQDSELVVLDDGSADNTASVLEQIRDPRLRVVRGENRGPALALQSLLQSTDSLFVARMDADDRCLPTRFKAQLGAIGDAEVIFTTVRSWDGNTRPHPPRPLPVSALEFPFHLLLTNPVAHPTMLATRSVLSAAGGYRDVPSEDLDLWLRLCANGVRLKRLARPGVDYRTHAAQITAARDWRQRSWRDERTNQAYAALAEHILGQRAMRITTLSVADLSSAEKARNMTSFAEAFRTAIAVLPPLARMRAERQLRAREKWFWGELR
ncbi:glycosyltransferase family 2 protein [Demetria terragena]|uniref:glycosyltransferase family 2 protein n=1 Tax=Demetria terragena TaxID=63959 RepID=UPI000375AEFA|nr:glycosyltransferase [Demetria terragena]